MACKCSDFELPVSIPCNDGTKSKASSLLVRPGIVLYQLDFVTEINTSMSILLDNDSYCVTLVRSGKINLKIENKKHFLLNQDSWIFTKAKNFLFDLKSNEITSVILLSIDKETMDSFIQIAEQEEGNKSSYFKLKNKPVMTGNAPRYLSSLGNQIDSQRAFKLIGRLELERDVIEWMILFFSMTEFQIFRSDHQGIGKKEFEKFQKIAAYLDMNFCEDISLKKIAAEFGISESKLKTGFKKVFSRTIFDYIRALRFKYAEKLIREKELSILEIAYEIGYSNPSHFSQAFKERYGELPKAYQLRYS